MPAWIPDRCLLSLAGAAGECRMEGDGWRDRLTGPRHPVRKVRCIAHRRSFTLYPVGHVPFGREPVVCQVEDPEEADSRASLTGAAVAVCRGERWPEDLILGEQGPAGRTQRRRIAAVGRLVGLDQPRVDSRVLGELGLDLVETGGKLSARVAAVGRMGPGIGAWLRIVGAVDLVGRLGTVGVLLGTTRSSLTPARGSRARCLRGPPP